MTNRLLIVEDDDRIRATLRLGLEDEGYVIVESASAESALKEVEDTPPDVMIVDLMLSGMDGFACIREVRRHRNLPIIVVSARTDSHDIVAGLEAGADDYVTKPFQIKEISARLRALLRRTRPAIADESSDAEMVIDSVGPSALVLSHRAGTVRRGEDDIHLTLTEFRLLSELASVPGRVVSRRSLLETVWDRDYFGDERIVDVHVRRLRAKIEPDPAHPCLILTVRGLGYRLDRR
ncbi:response regulator transcription factor [Tenggerimyces flavus]|uniref:Response regulator n=1 Tax=Tenggerimyces flavus TaxID=1708749 RepID=A0ABV7YRB2_9ACTN|nr:response regulator transcription factor [Tenggerimyces flavus]MBM7790252.1 DNA-binding response OmpR family regulator [Tenggerimyces flavus]